MAVHVQNITAAWNMVKAQSTSGIEGDVIRRNGKQALCRFYGTEIIGVSDEEPTDAFLEPVQGQAGTVRPYVLINCGGVRVPHAFRQVQ